MDTNSINNKVPLYAIFIFFLIIFSSSAANLFPCRLSELLENNILIKHIIAFLTIVFFVVLTVPIPNKKLNHILIVSVSLYIIFILLSKTEIEFFIPVIVLLGIMYIFVLKKNEYEEKIKINNDNNEKNKSDKITIINNVITLIVLILILIGFILYLGRKKYEYKDKFSYLTFIFGKTKCTKSFSKINYKKSLKYLIG